MNEMAGAVNDYDRLRKLLNRVQCPYRLFPARIHALEVFVQRDLSLEIMKKIATPITRYFVEMGWYKQFLSDYKVYGLYEAILYFHSYPFGDAAEGYINGACDLYHEIASLYMTHHESIEESDDPRIQLQLQTIRHMGGGYQHVLRARRRALDRPRSIARPVRPPKEPGYERKMPVSADLKFMYQSFGGGGEMSVPNLAEEIIEQLSARFMFEDFPGVQHVFFEVVELLAKFQIDPFGPTGQYVVETIVDEINMEMFGDFDRWVECINCGQEFCVSVSLDAANAVLIQGGWACEECRISLS